MLEHAFKLYEMGLNGRLRSLMNIDKMRYDIMAGKGTFDTVVILKRLAEKLRPKNKEFFVFVDHEKTFAWELREGVHFALRGKCKKGYVTVSVL